MGQRGLTRARMGVFLCARTYVCVSVCLSFCLSVSVGVCVWGGVYVCAYIQRERVIVCYVIHLW